MKNILVTGANGYIGRHVVDELVKRGYEVIASDIRNTGINGKASFCEYPILNGESEIYSILNRPDICIHLAWQDGFSHNASSHMANLSKHYEFLSNMVSGGCKNIAVMGSMHEIGYWEGAIDENTPCNPLSMYGIAKNALRQALLLLAKPSDFNLYWLRAYYILGDDSKNQSVFSKLLAAEMEGKREFPFTTGKNKYDFIDVNELANMIVDASTQDVIRGTINVCSGHPISLAEQVEMFISENDMKIKLKYGVFPDRPYDSPEVYGDNKLIDKIRSNKTEEI